MARQARPDSDHETATDLGGRIRQGRRAKQLSQRALAASLDMSQGHLSRLELGEHAPPSDEVLLRIAKELELDPRELLRAAGRQAAGATFEAIVLDRLDALTASVEELRLAVERIERS
jgi:transcriptional regulator with XRE-family HTH domain